MKAVILLRGVPGAGKTTLAEFIEEQTDGVAIAADDFFYTDSGEYVFQPEKLHEAHKHCFHRAELAIIAGSDTIIIHNTLTTEREILPYQELAERHGYMFISLIVENRHGGASLHDVPEHTIAKMVNRFNVKLV